MPGESSENQRNAILDMIKHAGERLHRWKEVIEEMYHSYQHDIPVSDEVNIGKLSKGDAVISDTCNDARKTRRLLVNEIKEAAAEMSTDEIVVLEVDCWNHLRNVWLSGMTKSLSVYLKNELGASLECIDPNLRVTVSIEMVLRAADKEFSLCVNYPKGRGDIFHELMDINYPGVLLLHVERASGSRQDLCVEGAGALYWNRKYWIEFLDGRRRTPGNNILQENLFGIFSSIEKTGLARVCSIVHLSICLPIR